MLKNRAIAAAISSAILAFAQVDAAPAATPLTTKGAAAKPANPPNVDHAPGDYDRALIVQQAREVGILRKFVVQGRCDTLREGGAIKRI